MRLPTPRNVRPGVSLLEVLISVAIFLLALGGITQLMSMATDHAIEVQMRNQTSRLCHTVMARVQCGDLPLSTQGNTPFDEDPDYQWSVTVNQGAPNQGSVNGLWTVTVTVTRDRQYEDPIQTTLTQMILDPSIVGSTQDVTPIVGTSQSSSAATGTGSTGSTTSNTGSSPGGAAPGGNKAMTPASSGSNAPKAPAPAPSGNSTPKATGPANTGTKSAAPPAPPKGM